MQERGRRTQRSQKASFVWWVFDVREGSKNSRVTQCTLWVVGTDVLEARTAKTSFGKFKTSDVEMAR